MISTLNNISLMFSVLEMLGLFRAALWQHKGYLYNSPLSDEWMGPSARLSPQRTVGAGTMGSPEPMLLRAAPAENSGIIPTDESISPPATMAFPRNMLATRLLNWEHKTPHYIPYQLSPRHCELYRVHNTIFVVWVRNLVSDTKGGT
jgi:hypothetical protein